MMWFILISHLLWEESLKRHSLLIQSKRPKIVIIQLLPILQPDHNFTLQKKVKISKTVLCIQRESINLIIRCLQCLLCLNFATISNRLSYTGFHTRNLTTWLMLRVVELLTLILLKLKFYIESLKKTVGLKLKFISSCISLKKLQWKGCCNPKVKRKWLQVHFNA